MCREAERLLSHTHRFNADYCLRTIYLFCFECAVDISQLRPSRYDSFYNVLLDCLQKVRKERLFPTISDFIFIFFKQN